MAIIIFIILVFLDSLMYGYIYEHQILCREYGLGIFNWSEWRFLWWIKYDWWEWIFERSLIVISNSRKIIGLIRKKNYQSHNRNSIGNNKFLKVHKNTKSFLQTTNSNFDLINTEGLIQIYKAIKIVKEKIQILINEYHKKGV
ncbi:MAG: hypothetical protein NTU73_09930, partial [Ignavibacteriae bacterium]|nr:hypothetical protein [Ignavibacteriota bacterium]